MEQQPLNFRLPTPEEMRMIRDIQRTERALYGLERRMQEADRRFDETRRGVGNESANEGMENPNLRREESQTVPQSTPAPLDLSVPALPDLPMLPAFSEGEVTDMPMSESGNLPTPNGPAGMGQSNNTIRR